MLKICARLGVTRIKGTPRPSGVTVGSSTDSKKENMMSPVKSFAEAMKAETDCL